MNMKKMTAVCVLLASGGLPHALADSSSGLPGQSVSSQMAASTLPDEEEEEVGGDGEGGEGGGGGGVEAGGLTLHTNNLKKLV